MINIRNGVDSSGHIVKCRDETVSEYNDEDSNNSLIENDSDFEAKSNEDFDMEKRYKGKLRYIQG